MKKVSRKWQDLTYEEQTKYLRKHRKSKQRPTGMPVDPRFVEVNEIKQTMGGLNKMVEGKEEQVQQQADEWLTKLKQLGFTELDTDGHVIKLQRGNVLASVGIGKGKMRWFAHFDINPIHTANCKYIKKDDVYYMKCDGENIPVDIDAPPKFKANSEMIIKQAVKEFLTRE